MTAAAFAQLCDGKKVGKDKWSGLCLAHGDRHRSLSICVGKRRPVLFRCMSSGCTPASILAAMGLTWRDLLGDRIVSPAVSQRMLDQTRLRCLETRWLALELLKVIGWEDHDTWATAEAKTDYEIVSLRAKMERL